MRVLSAWWFLAGVCSASILAGLATQTRMAAAQANGTQATGAQTAHAQRAQAAATPPMGWNSWDSYGLTITEPQFRANVAVLRNKLRSFGWQYAVIDEGWYFQNPQDRPTPRKLRYDIDSYGRFVPDPTRFPSAIEASAPSPRNDSSAADLTPATIQATSFTSLARWVHAQGLKFGIHIIRGIPKVSVERNLPIQGSRFHAQDAADQNDACSWDPTSWGVRDNPAGQAWYDSLLRQYASWGVDLIKVDCIAAHPYKLDEIRMIRRAIEKTGRPIVLSLSPGPTALDHAAQVTQLANLWRISNDEWDLWSADGKEFPQGVEDQFARLSAWARYAGPGHWPDADMLPLGRLRPNPGWGSPRATRLTPAEQRTQVTLWSIARSPLILGANLTLLDPPTLALLTNREVLAIDQRALRSRELLHQGNLIVWQADLPSGEVALAIFNIGETPLDLQRGLAGFNPQLGAHAWRLRDLWAGQDLGQARNVTARLAPHACRLLLLRPIAATSFAGP
ncbi:MAG: glycoside hydrolase family 27 protein [Acidobacteriota bacterium]